MFQFYNLILYLITPVMVVMVPFTIGLDLSYIISKKYQIEKMKIEHILPNLSQQVLKSCQFFHF